MCTDSVGSENPSRIDNCILLFFSFFWFLLLTVSGSCFDRYIAVTQPIKYARHKNHKRVWLTIGLVWAISAAIGSPIVLGLNHTPSRDPTLCMFYNSDFVIYSSLSSFYIPCIIMVFLYYQIFKVRHLYIYAVHCTVYTCLSCLYVCMSVMEAWNHCHHQPKVYSM